MCLTYSNIKAHLIWRLSCRKWVSCEFQPSVTHRLLIHDGSSKGFGTVQLWPLCSLCTGTSWAAAVKLSLLHGRYTLASSWRVQSPPDGSSCLILLLSGSFRVLGLTPLCSLWIYCWFTNPPLRLSSSFCRVFFGMVCYLQYIKIFAARKAPWISG